MQSRPSLRELLPAVSSAIPIIIMFITILSVPLSAAQTLRLSVPETTAWIWALYGLPGVLCLFLARFYRQPLLLTGNIFAILFLASLGDESSYGELVGASMVAGGIVTLLALLGVTDRLARWIPVPIMLGLLAGAVLPYVVGVFTDLGQHPGLIGSTLVTYLLARRFLGRKVPPILPALLAGSLFALLAGEMGPPPASWTVPLPEITRPRFAIDAILSAAPILVILMTLQANVPSIILLKGLGYEPPEKALNVVSGAGTFLGSLLGPTAVSVPILLTPLAAGPEAGRKRVRYWSVYVAGSSLVAMGLLSGVAAELAAIIPAALLRALAGLSLVGVLISALRQISEGPLLLGPLFTFATALSPLAFFGLGRYFWALLFGLLVSLLLERREMRALHSSKEREKPENG